LAFVLSARSCLFSSSCHYYLYGFLPPPPPPLTAPFNNPPFPYFPFNVRPNSQVTLFSQTFLSFLVVCLENHNYPDWKFNIFPFSTLYDFPIPAQRRALSHGITTDSTVAPPLFFVGCFPLRSGLLLKKMAFYPPPCSLFSTQARGLSPRCSHRTLRPYVPGKNFPDWDRWILCGWAFRSTFNQGTVSGLLQNRS